MLSTEGVGGVTIWSGSQTGADVAYAVENAERWIPEVPDVVVMNFGHNDDQEEFTSGLSSLDRHLTDEYGEVARILVLQNPQTDDANAAVREAGRQRAEEAGVGLIDVATPFAESTDDLMLDDVHPNQAGQELWARVVGEALG